jgi:hypothetical protein
LWYGGEPTTGDSISVRPWVSGDVIGVYLNIEEKSVIFYINGELIGRHTEIFKHVR